MDLKKKKFKIIKFFLKELMQSPNEFKLVKGMNYFIDAVNVSDFKQVFADPELRRLICTIVINSRLNVIFKSNFFMEIYLGTLKPL